MRWSLRSWWGFAVGMLITVPRVIDLLAGRHDVIDVAMLLVFAWVTYISLERRVEATDEGIVVAPPGTLRLPWSSIERFEVRRALGSSVVAIRRDRTRPSTLSVYGVGRATAEDAVRGLNERLTASRSG